MFCGLSATLGAFRLGALPAIFRRSGGQRGGARFIRASSFPFPFGLSARRRAERFGRWGHPESLLEQADWGGVAGAGVRAGGAKTGSRSRSLGGAAAGRPGFRGGGLFPRRQRQFRSGRAKKQATKRRTKKDFPSPKRRRFVKTGFSARYKEARRSGRPRGRLSRFTAANSGQCGRLSHFAVEKSKRRSRLLHFAVRNSGRRGRLSRFTAEKSQRGGRLCHFAVKKSGRRGRLSHFAVKKSGRRGRLSRFAVKKSGRRGRLWGGPQGGIESLETPGWRPPRPFA